MESEEGLNLLQEPSSGMESDAEVSLVCANEKPSSTDELKNMLKEAGTELTVKYITGEVTFEVFYQELEKRRAKQRQTASAATHSDSHKQLSYKLKPNIPHFDELMDDENEDNDSDDNEAWEDDDDGLDAGELIDKKDQDWQPDNSELKELKKTDGKDKKSAEGVQMRTKSRKPRRRQFEIPKYLANQHGQAMLLRAQGKVEEAMMLLFDIIEKAPQAAAPFKTLGCIHEEKGDLEQALKFFMVAANLRKSDIGEWFDLSDMWSDLKNEKMVLMCFTKAFKYARTNTEKLDVLSRRIMYFEKYGHPPKNILMCKDQMIAYMSQSNPDQVLDFARNVAKEFIDMQEINGAISCMLNYIKELPNVIDSEDVHLLVELLMSQKRFQKCLEIIIKLCGVEVEVGSLVIKSSNVEQFFTENASKVHGMTELSVPSVMPIDLKCKLVQCLLLGEAVESIDVLKDLLTDVSLVDIEEYGDIHYEIAETLIECGFNDKAKPLLHALVQSDSFSKAAVWLTYGQCLNSLGEIAAAAKSYEKVLELAPGHYGARVTLSSLRQQMGHHDQALELLSKDPTREAGASTDQLLLLRKCQLLYSQGKMDEFVVAAQQLLSFNLRGQFKPDFIRAILRLRTTKHRVKMFPQLLQINKDFSSDSSAALTEQMSELQKSEQIKFRKQVWDVYGKLCTEMYKQNRLDELVESSIMGISCPTFCFDHEDSRSLDAEFLCLKICILSRSKHFVNNIAKAVIMKAVDRNQMWNLYCYVGTVFKNIIDLRFAMRALMKNPDSLALRMLNGSARLISGSYKQALGEYLSIFRKMPENDLALLCCGLCLVHIASQSFSDKRNLLLAQVMCLMNAYKGARGDCQETFYNLGRAMQQLNIPYMAVYYYKKALAYPPLIEDDKGCFDLSHEIAFNLSLIYQQSGSEDYARYYIEKYCVI